MKEKQCEFCGSTFPIREMPWPSFQKRENAKRFCKPMCARQMGLRRSWVENREKRVESIRKTMNDPLKGPEIKRKMAEWQKGAKAPWWKGDKATYNSKHRWIQKHWERSGVCEHCGNTPPARRNGVSGTEWANISGNYDRDDRKDWYELCSKCHKFFDKGRKKV